jgi:hypothetical protein
MGRDDAGPSVPDGTEGADVMVFKRTGGEKVGPGDYWDLRNGTRVRVEGEAVLPGDESVPYVRASPWLMALAIPALGGVFAFYVPGIGIAFTLAWLGKLLAPGLVRWRAVARDEEAPAPAPELALAGAEPSGGADEGR